MNEPIVKPDSKVLKAVLTTIVVMVGLFFIYKYSTKSPGPEPFVRKRGGPCPGETKVMTQNDPYMRGVIEQGQKFKVIMNYYDCNKPKRGDIVLFQIHHSMDPVVKIIRGVQNDHFRLIKDQKQNAWNLEVEGDVLMSLVDKNEKYFFGGPMAPPLALYERAHEGKITGNGDVILMSSWPPGNIDSGQFGMFNLADVAGKVELMDGSTPIPQETKPEVEQAPEQQAPAKKPAKVKKNKAKPVEEPPKPQQPQQ